MNISYELSKIRDAFAKVRGDMTFLAEKVGENYDTFMNNHKKLADDVHIMGEKLKKQIDEIRHMNYGSRDDVTQKEVLDLKGEIKALKYELNQISNKHFEIHNIVSELKKTNKDVKDLKEKLHSSELEIFLIKERLSEKDVEVKQLKSVNKQMYKLIEDLSKLELELINNSKK
jgi:predicted RNase H-like nuclease (RuvC/YqgF family)